MFHKTLDRQGLLHPELKANISLAGEGLIFAILVSFRLPFVGQYFKKVNHIIHNKYLNN